MGFWDLFKPKWKLEDPKLRIEAIQELDDQEVLEELAVNDSNINVRRAAVKKVSDPKLKLQVIKEINDQDILIDFVCNDMPYWLFDEAFENITDQVKLKELTKREDHIGQAALKKIADQDFLYEFLILCKNEDLREAAVNALTDQNKIPFIAKNDVSPRVRKIAIEKVKDKRIRIDIMSDGLKWSKLKSFPTSRFYAPNLDRTQETHHRQFIQNIVLEPCLPYSTKIDVEQLQDLMLKFISKIMDYDILSFSSLVSTIYSQLQGYCSSCVSKEKWSHNQQNVILGDKLLYASLLKGKVKIHLDTFKAENELHSIVSKAVDKGISWLNSDELVSFVHTLREKARDKDSSLNINPVENDPEAYKMQYLQKGHCLLCNGNRKKLKLLWLGQVEE